jgi:hypothetical protein
METCFSAITKPFLKAESKTEMVKIQSFFSLHSIHCSIILNNGFEGLGHGPMSGI